ncbi:cytochrome b/b6 domain-containing protein [Glaciimonas sp. CA11.2]|uniref:cytochrome b/b6 domain-containing protein n=1 Tax=unclassified Glaciimonas TaxID=2644401 RepID=UPI002AB37CA6|nr:MULTISPECIES: cytochrome b/b6 domain-containing protein [unclassified Glaciimonas]MDY7546106.1 cytochrome b/b6 domain-containing protein [Glaciimonas sp. CA11.2]MEB0010939.1 cytochrome b/b6 domain-containing protein [Glaciimonas sp. Cout2]MEB0081721.1 cytochrome b/b6 domain-containing protein [Glaciimonas sp. Gout2]MEB0161685.1 cytochrome b/b6 domain-containing protein [Glaciimonas sp. CA11.2]
MATADNPRRIIHPLLVRIVHWINAFAIVCMVMSGWAIYNASPLFGFGFPHWATLGGWLGGAIAWHLAAMWLLGVNGLIYLGYGLLAGHFRRHFLPLRFSALLRDVKDALTLKLAHQPGVYNTVQRLMYIGVLLLGVLVVASGLSIWKPVQLDGLVDLFGGYDIARRVHFIAMAGIVGFVVVHLALVLIVPSTLLPMLTGRAPRHSSKKLIKQEQQ